MGYTNQHKSLINSHQSTAGCRFVRNIQRKQSQEAQLSLRDRATRACQLKSCKVLHKCRRLAFQKLWNWWMTFKVIQGHWRLCHLIGHIWFPISLPLEVYLYLVRFLRYQHLYANILKGHVTLTTTTWGTVCYLKANTSLGQPMHKIWSLYLQPFQRYFGGCKILKCVTWPRPRPFQGWLVVWRLTLDIACNHTKFDDCSFSRFGDISGGVKFYKQCPRYGRSCWTIRLHAYNRSCVSLTAYVKFRSHRRHCEWYCRRTINWQLTSFITAMRTGLKFNVVLIINTAVVSVFDARLLMTVRPISLRQRTVVLPDYMAVVRRSRQIVHW